MNIIIKTTETVEKENIITLPFYYYSMPNNKICKIVSDNTIIMSQSSNVEFDEFYLSVQADMPGEWHWNKEKLDNAVKEQEELKTTFEKHYQRFLKLSGALII